MKSQTEFNVEEQKIGRYLYFINSIIIYLHVPTYLYVVLYYVAKSDFNETLNISNSNLVEKTEHSKG